MKRMLLLSIMLLSLSGYCQTQNTDVKQPKVYFALKGGINIPLGDFASKNINNDNAGLAQNGYNMDIEFSFEVEKNFGLVFMYKQQKNAKDAQPIKDYIVFNQPTAYNTTVDATNWYRQGFLTGLYYSLPITKKLSLDTKVLLGYLIYKTPTVTTNGYYYNTWLGWIVQESNSSASTFSYIVGTGLKYDVGKTICFLLDAQYFKSEPKFYDVTTIKSDGKYTKSDFKQPITTIGFNLGIGCKF